MAQIVKEGIEEDPIGVDESSPITGMKETLGLWLWQFRTLLSRNLMQSLRNPGNFVVRIAIPLIVSILQVNTTSRFGVLRLIINDWFLLVVVVVFLCANDAAGVGVF